MKRSFAGRRRAFLALLVLLITGGSSPRAEFSGDSCLAAFELPVRSGGTNGVRWVVTGDLDGDGDQDLITASSGDDRIAWFENSGAGDPPADPPWDATFTRNTISTNANGAASVFVSDLNGDGHLDVLSASFNDNKIAWYLNDGRDEPKFTELEISTNAQLAQAVYAADLDGDDQIDVLSASFGDNKISWYESDGQNPPAFTEHVISTTAMGASSVYAADMDGDGDMDVLSASLLDDKVAWYESIAPANPEDDPPTFVEHVIASAEQDPASDAVRPTSVIAARLNGDDLPDVLVAANGNGVDSGKISWFESAVDDSGAGGGLDFTVHDVKGGLQAVRQVFAADPVGPTSKGSNFDAGSALDFLAAYDDTVAWFRNDGMEPPSFDEQVLSVETLGASSVHAADLDGDGIPDVQSASSVPGFRIRDDRISWFRNDGGTPPAFDERIVSVNAASPESIVVADIDGDCEEPPGSTPCLDVVSASSVDSTIAWHENDGQSPRPDFTQHDIDTSADGALSVFAADLDGDGDQDVLAAAAGDGIDGKISWYQNDGQPEPTLIEYPILDGILASPTSVHAADLDGDGDKDVIAAIRVEAEEVPDRVSWFENGGTDPATRFETEHVISTRPVDPRDVFAYDLDADGQMDVLVASTGDDAIHWFRSTRSDEDPPTLDPPEFEQIIVTVIALGAMSVHAVDLDGDCGSGDPTRCTELLSASSGDNKIAWYKIQTFDPPDGKSADSVAGGGAGKAAGALLSPGPTIALDPELLAFGETYVGRVDPIKLELSITNDGDEPLVISSIQSSVPEFVPSVDSLTVAPGTTEPILVSFVPFVGTTFAATLQLTSNADNEPSASVEMTGVGLAFVERTIARNRFFARFVSSGDVDADGRLDVLAASSGDGTVAAYLQQVIDAEADDPVPTFQQLIVSPAANDARAALAADLNADGFVDVVTAFFFEVAWHQGGVIESCNSFDADGDGQMTGTELAWIWAGFGQSVPDTEIPNNEWWEPVDFNKDGVIDGDDLAIGTSTGIWTRFVQPPTGESEGPLCSFSCVSQE